jgi:putative endonuclease
MANFYVYILKSSIDYTLYTGQTSNIKDRLKKHNLGQIKSTKNKIPYNLVYFEEYDSRAEAMQREWELKKKWNTKRKLRLIENFDNVKVNKILGP